ncbi:uncharacterized protein LOC114759436 [Neltuma alba]|uniref:uncharacterized protein LOC114759436 n=1 Tax=Neltuma alba TaxID=207710 RepID=UPI0010A34B7D|nr:uncharacterized protein LOC114759436 [Prosopis alba]
MTAARNRPFRFLAPWVMHEQFSPFVRTTWPQQGDWAENIPKFTKELVRWNRNVFGNINKRKEQVHRRLEDLNRKTTYTGSTIRLEQIRRELWVQLEEVLAQEEVMWLQKSRCNWYQHGDRNTRYFHSVANSRRRRNRIEALKLDSREWSYDSKVIMEMGTKFFESLYFEEPDTGNSIIFDVGYPMIDNVQLNNLGRQINNIEIKRALFDMSPLKAPGPDGLNPSFSKVNGMW